MHRRHSSALLVAALAVAGVRRRLRDRAVRRRDSTRRRRRCSRRRSSEQGQAKLDRLDQDETQKTCSEYAGKPLPKDVVAADREGEPRDDQVARRRQVSSATGRTARRSRRKAAACSIPTIPKGPVGANCYACHQLAPQELSYGTIGPSLYQFGKLRGYTDETRKYAYGKICNAEAYTACTNMPRFGHNGILTEAQIKDVVALLDGSRTRRSTSDPRRSPHSAAGRAPA